MRVSVEQISEQKAGRKFSTILWEIIETNFACVASCRGCRLMDDLLTSMMKSYAYNQMESINMNFARK